MEATIKAIHDSGVKIIIAGGPVSEMGLHFIQKYDMAVFKIVSKFSHILGVSLNPGAFSLRGLCRGGIHRGLLDLSHHLLVGSNTLNHRGSGC